MEIMIKLPFLRCKLVATKGATINSNKEALKHCNILNSLIHELGSDAPLALL